MRAALLLNPRAGTLLARPELLAEIPAALRAAGLEVLEIGEDAGPDLEARLEAALALRPEVVVVGGGDGSIRTAAARLAGGPVALAILPLGTLNLLARDMGVPLEPGEAAAALGQATLRQIDIGLVNGEVFLCQSVIGLPNRVGLHRERVRGRDGLAARWRVALGFLRALWRHPPMRLGLRPDGQPMRRVWTGAVSVVNNAYDEAPGHFFHRPRLDAGVLTWLVARDFDLWWAAKLIASMALGRWRGGAGLIAGEAASLDIFSRRSHLRVMNDGEAMLLRTPLRYSIRPRALRVLAPLPAEAPPQRAAEGAACG
ncbi:diacylglycerol kinase [Pseudoroseomonas wenyumeiae]|uniref:Diacylglycerol kinase n=1 Tax=Teichococcus wenyumeiae TaxID=2478470 RepID=A0A3A9JK18_9PROT|nr:diacylglycerol kinase family protein [Pseudoroseomonas wenyumeiae]RKK04024.1 diacylglycerol kinase [Pseudoroseomonas wenyumeiae]RMI20816.1 diacylglycerol kinase [Pseudoroseomonas wenyumeiae]